MALQARKNLVQVAGLKHPSDITAHHSVRRSTDQEVKSLAPSILTQMPDGVLLQKKLSALALIYRHSGPQASADSFLLQVL